MHDLTPAPHGSDHPRLRADRSCAWRMAHFLVAVRLAETGAAAAPANHGKILEQNDSSTPSGWEAGFGLVRNDQGNPALDCAKHGARE